MTPEEIDAQVRKLQAEHNEAMGAVGDTQAEGVNQYSDEDIAINVKSKSWQDIQKEHDELLGPTGSKATPPVIASSGSPVSGHASSVAAQEHNAASQRAETATDGAGIGNDPRKWTKETAKALDLSDASRVGEYSQEPDDSSALNELTQSAGGYMQRVTMLLRSLQSIVIEHTIQLDEIQSRFNRLR